MRSNKKCEIAVDGSKGDVVVFIDEDGDIASVMYLNNRDFAFNFEEDFIYTERPDLLPGLYYVKLVPAQDKDSEDKNWNWEILEDPICTIKKKLSKSEKQKAELQKNVGFYDFEEFKI